MGWTDTVSAITSSLAALVALATLLTVYTAGLQILSKRRLFNQGISPEALGKWHSEVVRGNTLYPSIHTPTISFANLVRTGQQLSINTLQPSEYVETRWVNFLQCLGIKPPTWGNHPAYTMTTGSEMIDGVLPIRWTGSDLVALCAILGFQSTDKKLLDHLRPMPLPMQWNGPIGWIQFRASSDGCIAYFRPKSVRPNLIPSDTCIYFQKWPRNLPDLEVRAWRSISAMKLSTGRALFLGALANPIEGLKLRCFRRNPQEIFRLTECEKASVRGLDLSLIISTDQVQISEGKAGSSLHKFGATLVPGDLLPDFKDGLLGQAPDGYFFTGTNFFMAGIRDFFCHIRNGWNELRPLLQNSKESEWSFDSGRNGSHRRLSPGQHLLHTLKIIDVLAFANSSSPSLTDIVTISSASARIRGMIGSNKDLIWAMIYSPDMFLSLASALGSMSVDEICSASGQAENGKFRAYHITGGRTYKIALLDNANFQGVQILAAVIDVILTRIWMDLGWETNVCDYDSTIPYVVRMC